jgi:putative ABC transport system permease protein
MNGWKHDFNYGFRMLVRNPGFTIVILLSLALGIGANTAIFSLINTVLLNPLPFRDSDRLVMVWEDASFVGFPQNTPAPANYADWKSQNHVFTDMAAVSSESFSLTGGGDPLRAEAQMVTANFFPLLGVRPHTGRIFLPEEDKPGAANVVVLSYGLWQSRYGANLQIVGSDILLNNSKYTVLGVMPANFQFLNPEVQLWVPMAFTPENLQSRNSHYLEVVARLKDGVSFEKAQAEISTIMKRIAAQHPDETGDGKLGAFIVSLRDQVVGDVRRPLVLLLIAVGFVLLIACANIANLLLCVGASRRKEIAVRAALGAGKRRIMRQLLTESLMLSFAGGMLGIVFGSLSLSFLRQLIPPGLALIAELTIDWKVLLYTSFISILTGLIFGIAPSLQAASTNLNEALKSGGGRSGLGGNRKLRSAMVIAEMSLAVVLLIGAALLIQTIYRLQTQNLGFRPANMLRILTILPRSRYDTLEKKVQFYSRALERIDAIPGIVDAGYSTSVPLIWKGGTSGYEWEGRPLERSLVLDANHRQVTSRYLQTMGFQLTSGRYFDGTETLTSVRVAVINEAMAKTYSSNESSIGKRFRFDAESPWLTVIGIVKNVRNMGIQTESKPEMYIPVQQADFGYSFYAPRDLAIRTKEDPQNITGSVRQVIKSIDPDLPISGIMTMDQILAREISHRRLTMFLLAAFAGLALLLACLGIYGVLSYFVNQQIPEIGVRLALGAKPFSILGLILKRGMILVLIGIIIGIGGALALTKIMQSLLYEVSARDPWTFVAVAFVLSTTALAACCLPGRRAMRVDPVTALHYE